MNGRLAAMGAALAMLAGAALVLWWGDRQAAHGEDLVERLRVSDSTITALWADVGRTRDSVRQLASAPARVVERWHVGIPDTIPSPPDTIDVTDTAAVRLQLAAHVAVEDSLRAQVRQVVALGQATIDTLGLALTAERRLTTAQGVQLAALTSRAAIADALIRTLRPRWTDRLVVAVGYGVRSNAPDVLIGVKLPLPRL